MTSSLRLSLLVLLAVSSSLVSSRPSPQDPDSELFVPVPPPQAPFVPFFFSFPGESGGVVGEVIVSSPKVAVKRTNKKKNAKNDGPSFAARVSRPGYTATSALDDTNTVADTIFFNQPSAVIQLS